MSDEYFLLKKYPEPESVQIGSGVGDVIVGREDAGGTTILYKMRGQDDGAVAPGYVTWKSDFPDFLGVDAGSSVPALVGSLIPGSVVQISEWIP